jgi:hypothetical protein
LASQAKGRGFEARRSLPIDVDLVVDIDLLKRNVELMLSTSTDVPSLRTV